MQPVLLQLYDRFLLPLGPALLPSINALIVSLLPGLEEEQGESFAPTLQLMDGLGVIAGFQRYFRILFLAVVQYPSGRLAALNLLLRRLPRLVSAEGDVKLCPVSTSGSWLSLLHGSILALASTEVAQLLGSDIRVVVAAFNVALADPNVLVQRQAMELLTVQFPLDRRLFDEVVLEELMTAALKTVLRKEMSLNRRLYNWWFGTSSRANRARCPGRKADAWCPPRSCLQLTQGPKETTSTYLTPMREHRCWPR